MAVRYRTTFMITFFLGAILVYFFYHIWHGERGLIAKEHLEKELSQYKTELASITAERQNIYNKIKRLGSGGGMVDKDLLTEYLEKMGYTHPDDLMVVKP
jgi:cell division protein FtsB